METNCRYSGKNRCKYCGKQLPVTWSTDSCLPCSKQRVSELFKQDPQLEKAFKESINEMKKPENMQKMVDSTVRLMNGLMKLRDSTPEEYKSIED